MELKKQKRKKPIYGWMQQCGAISVRIGLGMDWISPGGVMYRAPYGANKEIQV